MTSSFNDSTKQIADKLIAMSTLLNKKIETWAEVFARHPDSQNIGICAGFISTQTSENRIEIVIDVQTPPEIKSGLLRARAIEAIHDQNGNERFTNISLQYTVDPSNARQLVEKAGSITREDIKQLLHADTSKLESLAVGDEAGRDNETQQLLGKHYDLDAGELTAMSESNEKQLTQTLNTVLAKLEQTAASETE